MNSRSGNRLVSVGAAALVVGLAVFIYSRSSTAFFFNDDFNWLDQSWHVSVRNFFDLSRYGHFYRPVIELYFEWGLKHFRCDPVPFHWTSVGIHVVTSGLVYLFAREVGMARPFAYIAALWFVVQSGPVEAVAWIGAITDLMPGLWYILALWLFAVFLFRRRTVFYPLTLLVFVVCLLTHESSATLLVMLVAVDVILRPRGAVFTREAVLARLRWYAPFAVLLAGYLALAYLVNTRSYLVTEGHYRFGLHAGPKLLDYFVAILVWVRGPVQDVAIVAGIVLALVIGTPRTRFFMVWILVTLLPVLFFTWGIAARYEYVPAAGFCLIVAELLGAWYASPSSRVSLTVRHVAIAVVAAVLVVRSTHFARKGTADHAELSRPYEALRTAVLAGTRDSEGRVVLDRALVDPIPPMYVSGAVRISLCQPGVQTVVR